MSLGKILRRSLVVGSTILGLSYFASTAFIVPEKEQAYITRFGKIVGVVVDSNVPTTNGVDRVKVIEEWNQQIKAEHDAWKLAKKEGKPVGKEPTRPVRIYEGAGLHFKTLPFIYKVEKGIEDRVLEYSTESGVVNTGDKKRIKIEFDAKWYIENPALFKLRVNNETGAQSRLDDTIFSALKDEVGKYPLLELLRSDNDPIETFVENKTFDDVNYGRDKIVENVTESCRKGAREFGIYISDVRIRKVDLLPQNKNAVYKQMIAEREAMSAKLRGEGFQEAAEIDAATKSMVAEIEAFARVEAGTKRGAGDMEAATIFGEVYNRNPEFVDTWLKLSKYKSAFKDGSNTTIIMEPDSEFNKYINSLKLK